MTSRGEPEWNTFEIDGTDDDQHIIEDMGNGRIYLNTLSTTQLEPTSLQT